MKIEDRVAKLEADLKVIASVLTGVTDDTLRTNLVLRELESGGYLPELPWDLASALVDLQYAKQMQMHGDVTEDKVPIEVKIAELEIRVRDLRAAFRNRADEQSIG